MVNVVNTVKALYFAVFPMNMISLEFNFEDFAFVTLLKCTAKMFVCYLISRKQVMREICEINPTQNLRLGSICSRTKLQSTVNNSVASNMALEQHFSSLTTISL